jgi:hypothetical protein
VPGTGRPGERSFRKLRPTLGCGATLDNDSDITRLKHKFSDSEEC